VKKLEKWKSNQVFEAVEAAGLNPTEFDWDDSTDDICLRHRWSEAYFFFIGAPGRYIARYAAGDERAVDVQKFSWEALMSSVGLWLSYIKRDVETPDLWAELQRETELLGDAWRDAVENAPFTPNERADVARQLQELRRYVQDAYSLSERQLSDLDSKIDFLVDAAARLGRKDWLVVFIGTMAGFVLVAVLPPDAARHIVLAFLSGISHWLGHGFRELGSG